MVAKYSKKHKSNSASKNGGYRVNNETTSTILSSLKEFKEELASSLNGQSKTFKKEFKLPDPRTKSGKTLKKVVIVGSLVVIMSFTVGLPVTICVTALALFLLLYK